MTTDTALVDASPDRGWREELSLLARGLVVQAEVVHAVFLRETRTRFGNYRLGYLWAIADPIIIIATFYTFFRLLGRSAPLGMDVFEFLTTGLLPYRLFASCAAQVGEAVNGNRALLFYPRVLPVDLAIARGLFEFVTYTTVFIVLMGGHALYTQHLAIESPLHVIAGLLLLALLGTAVGLVFCAIGVVWSSADKARGAILRPFFWISGVFFTMSMLPGNIQALASLNPIIHGVELVRGGWFVGHGLEHASLTYLLRVILGLTLAGLLLERYTRPRIEL
ncbi:MAG: ABC transporter permease [Myxococcales bacterium]|nr:ABC transporter permease [Myxococcales bacterium]